MDIIFIIGLIVFVFILALIIILVKKILKIATFIFLLFLVFTSAFTVLIYLDAEDIKKEFPISNKLFLLTDEDEILTGLIIIADEPVFIDENQINIYTDYYQNNDYESLLGENYKLMLVKLDILNELDDEHEILDEMVSREKLFDIFGSEEPFKELKGREAVGKILINDEEIEEENKIKFKGFLFMTLLANDIISSNNPVKLMIFYKQGYIDIYPETILFKVIKAIPTSFINQITAKITTNIEKVKEKI